MKIEKWQSFLCFFIIITIFSTMFFLAACVTFFVVALSLLAASPYLLMDEKYQFLLSMKKYDLECAIIAALRSSRIINRGKDWLYLIQIMDEVKSRLGNEDTEMGCTLVLKSLVDKGVVETEVLFGEVAYALADKSYLPKKPERIEKTLKNQLRMA